MRTSLSTVFLFALLLTASLGLASPEKIEGFLEEIDPWVVDDTSRVYEFIERHNQETVETIQASPHWEATVRDLTDLFGVDYLGSPGIDNTGRIYFQMRITGEKGALFYVDKPWSWPIQLTPNGWTERGLEVGSFRLDPDGDYFYLRVMKHGDENWDIYRFERDGSRRVLIEDREVQFGTPLIIDDDSFYFSIDNREQMWTARYRISDARIDTLYTEEGAFFPLDNRQGKVLCLRYRSFSEMQLFELDASTGHVTDLTGLHVIWSGDYTEDGRIVALTDARSAEEEFTKLVLIDPEQAPVAPENMKVLYDPGVEIDGVSFNRKTGRACVMLNRDGYSELVAVDLEGNTVPIPMPGVGVTDQVDMNDLGEIVYDYSAPSTPPAAFYHKLGEPDIEQIGQVSTFGFDFSKVNVQVVKYASSDATLIPALLYVPTGVKRNGSNPCIVEYHGGPPGQSRPYFQRNIAFGLARGVIYLFPNVRGSTGYGPAWEMADNLEGRFKALEDAEAALDYLIAEGWTNPSMTAIWGASYGGYTVNYLSVHAPEKFACAVSEVGVADVDWCNSHSDQVFLAGWEREMGPLGSELTRKLSPIFFADAIQRPILLTGGFNDPRVPASGPRRFVHVLERLGKEVLYYEEVEAGHGANTKTKAAQAYARTYSFMFDRILRPANQK